MELVLPLALVIATACKYISNAASLKGEILLASFARDSC